MKTIPNLGAICRNLRRMAGCAPRYAACAGDESASCRLFDMHTSSHYSTKVCWSAVAENCAPARRFNGLLIHMLDLQVLLLWQCGASVYPGLNSEVERSGTPETRRAQKRSGSFAFCFRRRMLAATLPGICFARYALSRSASKAAHDAAFTTTGNRTHSSKEFSGWPRR
jgi:hypothetical protein